MPVRHLLVSSTVVTLQSKCSSCREQSRCSTCFGLPCLRGMCEHCVKARQRPLVVWVGGRGTHMGMKWGKAPERAPRDSMIWLVTHWQPQLLQLGEDCALAAAQGQQPLQVRSCLHIFICTHNKSQCERLIQGVRWMCCHQTLLRLLSGHTLKTLPSGIT